MYIYIYINLFFFRFFSIIDYYKILNIVPCATQVFVVYFIYSSMYLLIPNPSFIQPRLPFPFGNPKFVFYVCESISVL